MGVGISKQIGWSQEANLLYEILRELDYLNLVTADVTGNCVCPTTTTTTTSTPTSRKVWAITANPMFRGGFQTNFPTFWVGNTYAAVSATNTDFVHTGLKANNSTVPRGERWTRTIGDSEFGTFYPVSADYNFTDDLGVEIMKQLQDFYNFVKKIVANSFMASRNPVIKIYRMSYPQVEYDIDGWWTTFVEFDSTGTERDGYTIDFREYDPINFPTVLTFPFTYGTFLSASGSGSASNYPMGLNPPYADWVLGTTFINGTFDFIVQEEFPIPPLWG
jgi:hypothetical protein